MYSHRKNNENQNNLFMPFDMQPWFCQVNKPEEVHVYRPGIAQFTHSS
jgi:hypothetical protein